MIFHFHPGTRQLRLQRWLHFIFQGNRKYGNRLWCLQFSWHFRDCICMCIILPIFLGVLSLGLLRDISVIESLEEKLFHISQIFQDKSFFYRKIAVARLFLFPNQIAYIGTFPGKNLIIKILLPVNISNAVLQFFDRSAKFLLFFSQHFFSWHNGCFSL